MKSTNNLEIFVDDCCVGDSNVGRKQEIYPARKKMSVAKNCTQASGARVTEPTLFALFGVCWALSGRARRSDILQEPSYKG